MNCRLLLPRCPACHSKPWGVVHTIVAEIDDEEGVWGYTGNTELDSQTALIDPERPGELRLSCSSCPEAWWSPVVEVGA